MLLNSSVLMCSLEGDGTIGFVRKKGNPVAQVGILTVGELV